MLTLRATAPAEQWRGIFDAVNAIGCDEFRLHIESDHLWTRAVDAATVAMVDLSIDASEFDAFGGEEAVIGVEIESFTDVLTVADTDEAVTVQLEDGIFTVSGTGWSFDLTGIDPNAVRTEPDIPDLELATSVSVGGSWLQSAVDGCDIVADHLNIIVAPAEEAVRITADGDTDSAHFERGFDELDGIDHTAGEQTESMFSQDYMDGIVSALDGDRAVQLGVDQENPVILSQVVGGGLDIDYILAPRIQSD